MIEDCVLLDPKHGYERAKQLLKQNFGNFYDIARTYIDGLIYGETIEEDNPKKLLDFSRELTKTEDTLTALGYTADINATSNLILIAAWLSASKMGRSSIRHSRNWKRANISRPCKLCAKTGKGSKFDVWKDTILRKQFTVLQSYSI